MPQVSILRPGFLWWQIIAIAATLAPLIAIGCHQAEAIQPSSGPTTIEILPQPLQTNVKRLGINLGGQSFYDSGQILRNLTFRNPGFEGEIWQSILHCKAATPTTCTDANQYTVWPDGFLDGAQLEVLSNGNTTTIQHSTAAADGHGITLTFPAVSIHPGDYILIRTTKPGDAQAGWWTSLNGGAYLLTETRDLSPHTEGHQALRIEASAPGRNASISSYFDSLAGHSFVHLNGTYTLRFKAKGTGSVGVRVERLDTTHGLHSFFSKTIPLSANWQDYTYAFTAAEASQAVGTVGLTFYFDHTTALLDDVALTESPSPTNPTAFRNAVVETLRALRPGVLRYMDSGGNFGSSLDNMLATPFARQRAGASTQEKLHEDIPLGLHEFLVLCEAVHAEPWYAMQPGMSPQEAANLIEYLAGPPQSPYGQKRAALGHPAPWTTAFPVIHLELGNEEWNARSFAGSAIDDPTAYARRATAVFAAARAHPAFRPASFDLILGSWAALPWWTAQELASVSGLDSVTVAPYFFNDFNDATSDEAIFGPMLAAPQQINGPGGSVAQQRDAARKAHTALSVYEVNLGALSGTASQAALDRAIPSLGAGLANAEHMLLMLRDLGIKTQCLFALPEFVNNFPGGAGAQKTVPLWGAVVDMGGATNRRRPQFLAEQLTNDAILPTLLTTRVNSPTWHQPRSTNDSIELPRANLIETFAFTDGPHHSLILLNLSRTDALPVTFTGLIRPGGTVTQQVLNAPGIADSNEHETRVTVTQSHLPSFDPTKPYVLPAHSMTTLKW